MSNVIDPAQLPDYIGKEVGVTDWLEIDQERIDKFAEATGDFQYIHVDPQRAAKTPFGTTIAHGFLTLSLLSMLSNQNGGVKLKDAVMGINYGLDRLRFLNPVKVGSRIRARFTLVDATEKQPGRYLLKHHVTVEIEGEEKPALIAEWLGMTVV
jgi:acyl dehydratase